MFTKSIYHLARKEACYYIEREAIQTTSQGKFVPFMVCKYWNWMERGYLISNTMRQLTQIHRWIIRVLFKIYRISFQYGVINSNYPFPSICFYLFYVSLWSFPYFMSGLTVNRNGFSLKSLFLEFCVINEFWSILPWFFLRISDHKVSFSNKGTN